MWSYWIGVTICCDLQSRQCLDRIWCPSSLQFSEYRVPSPKGIKRPGREADHSPPIAEVNSGEANTSLQVFMALCLTLRTVPNVSTYSYCWYIPRLGSFSYNVFCCPLFTKLKVFLLRLVGTMRPEQLSKSDRQYGGPQGIRKVMRSQRNQHENH
jgi:hypothetical protein